MGEGSSDRLDALRTGTELNGYEVESVLGHGGFGIVYKARHLDLGTIVAIKEFLPIEIAVRDGLTVHPRSSDCADAFEESKKRFLGEAKQLSQFRGDPSVVTCLEFFRTNGTAYLVMQYEEGLPLSELLERREEDGNPLDEADLLMIAERLLKGLSRVHEAGVLHRDIKPSNIFIRRKDSHPVLIDFGAAKRTVALQTKSLAPYTEGYAAIEQVGEGNLGTWTDLYGVGAVMWRVVAGGKPPWTPPNPTKVESRLSAIARGRPDPLPSARAIGAGRFSESVLGAIDECLILPEAQRVQNCGQLLQRIRGRPPDAHGKAAQGGNTQSTRPKEVEHSASDRSNHQIHQAPDSSKTRSGTVANRVLRILLRAFAALIGLIFYAGGRGILDSPDVPDESALAVTALGASFHLSSMIVIYLVFFRWNRTMKAPPISAERHRIPLACFWYLIGFVGLIAQLVVTLFVAYSSVEAAAVQRVIMSQLGNILGLEMVIFSVVGIAAATGLLYRTHWALKTVVALSFIASLSIGGLFLACYTWWVSSFRTAESR